MRAFGYDEIKKSLTNSINFFFSFSVQIGAMDPTRIGLFDLAEKRLAWTAQRQSVLASNIANANTPAFPQPGHMSGTTPAGLASLIKDPPNARALDGNAVSLDQQLTKVADTETTQALVTTIWKKYTGMFSMALGRSG
jgi:flagellar basal-body rod protein FlgB